eukprot:scaffold5372_cov114-Isochrysis_galbana.AAC.13
MPTPTVDCRGTPARPTYVRSPGPDQHRNIVTTPRLHPSPSLRARPIPDDGAINGIGHRNSTTAQCE